MIPAETKDRERKNSPFSLHCGESELYIEAVLNSCGEYSGRLRMLLKLETSLTKNILAF